MSLEAVAPLLALIRKLEGRNDYNIVWGGIGKADHPPRPLTNMMVKEVLEWQKGIDRLYRSEAAGAYQIMEDTLRDLMKVKSHGVLMTDIFSEKVQDKLAYALLERRGLSRYLAGEISAMNFAQQVSKEWASLPCTIVDAEDRAATGQSFYAGDGLNKAHTDIATFLAAVRACRAPIAVSAAPKEETTSSFIFGILSDFFSRLKG